ncbi:MAG: UvrD-helicase domain-containing protein [Bacteroidales bacterium]
MSDLLKDLNESQRKAVEHLNGPSLIIAGAGSGKTRVLTYKLANLLEHGVPPGNILALTFTNKAAREMKERIDTLLQNSVSKNLWMGTFHSLFSRILRFEAQYLGYNPQFTIYDSTDSKNLVKKIIKEMNLDAEKYKPGVVLGSISKAKNKLILPHDYIRDTQLLEKDRFMGVPQIADIYATYHQRCKQADAMDFDDLLVNINVLFLKFPEILNKYRNKFNYILVDEYQDTNFAQYLIIRKLSEIHRNICVVGDDAQSIYSFRGAQVENILKFRDDYKEYTLFKLEQNYRSTQTIVNAANTIILKNKHQIPKKTFTLNEVGQKIKVVKTMTDTEEGLWVAQKIYSLQKNEGCRYDDFAILYRTNAQSRIFEESLNKYKIPCKIYGGIAFFQRKEIKDLLSYLRFVVNPNDEEAFERIINYPARGIGETSVEKIIAISREQNVSIWTVINTIEDFTSLLNKALVNKIIAFRTLIESFQKDTLTADAYSLALRIADEAGIIKDLREDKSIEGIGRYENIQELLNGIKDFTESQETNIYIGDYLQMVSLLTDTDENDENGQNKVKLMTIHSAKGLEFKHCFIVGLEESLFPSLMTMESEANMEEERRLFYVALTRAEKTATLTYASSRRKWGKLNMCSPSRFLKEIDSSYLDFTEAIGTKTSGLGGLYNKNNFDSQSTSHFDTFEPTSKLLSTSFKKFDLPSQETSGSTINTQASSTAIKEGMTVIHESFGKGEVKIIEGILPNQKAVIDFELAGRKTLLLKYAKLKIV